MFRKFASIAHSDKYGYAYDSEKWEYRTAPFLQMKFRMFETCGDGLTQHSPDWSVTEDFATDYLFSLAAVMIEDEELARDAAYCFNDKPRAEIIKFASALVYNPEKDKEWAKQRFFYLGEQKVTRNPDKRHDDRYKELKDWHDGTPKSIYSIIVPEHCHGLTRWIYANAVRDWAGENMKNGFMEMPAVHLGWFKDGVKSQGEQFQRAREFRDAVESCQSIGESYRQRKIGIQEVQCYRDGLERKAQREAETLTAETASTETTTA